VRQSGADVLRDKGFDVRQGPEMVVTFRGKKIGTFYADLVVNDVVLVEVKTIPAIDNRAIPQVLNYLKAAGGGVGLLLNFGRYSDYKRLVVGDPFANLPNLMPRTRDRGGRERETEVAY
jgi:GxxExxY protein